MQICIKHNGSQTRLFKIEKTASKCLDEKPFPAVPLAFNNYIPVFGVVAIHFAF